MKASMSVRRILREIARRCALASLSLTCLTSCATVSDNAAASSTTIDATSDVLVPVEIRGQQLKLRVDPRTPGYVLLNGSAAQRLGLTRSAMTTFVVGPIAYQGDTSFEDLTIGGIRVNRPVMWFRHEMVEGADGAINPAHLPWDSVTLRLGARRPDERTISLPMQFDSERGLFYSFEFSGETILTRFTLADRPTTATGATAALLAERKGGQWAGDTFMQPVRYDIVRPVREMAFRQPVSVGGFALMHLMVRVSDDLGSYRLPAGVASASMPMENSIVITGRKRRSPVGTANFWLMIGRDDLSRCSEMSYYKRAEKLLLRCSSAGS